MTIARLRTAKDNPENFEANKRINKHVQTYVQME